MVGMYRAIESYSTFWRKLNLSMTVLNHLHDALDSLESARDEANLGTSMMLDEIINDLDSLITRFEQNND
jgi:hypothetical protein